jgi:hypothetical protein
MSGEFVRTFVYCVGAVTSAVVYIRPQNPVQVGFVVSVETGAINATVQFTVDSAAEIEANSARWLPHPYAAALTANAADNMDKPCTALRLVNAGSGRARLTVLQAV